jgi:tetratricopeptide (TPR) repeat protein
MSLFDFLFGPRAPEIHDPDQLREALFQAAGRGDRKRLEGLCRKNRQAVLDHFPRWQKPPEALRSDPAAMQGYVHGLVSVAQVFAERLGCPDLLNRLMGTPDSNPLLRWQDRLGQAQQLMAELRYQEARDLLTDVLIDVRELEGTGADKYRPVTLGCLGECYFQDREADKAVPHLEQALQLCAQTGDQEGVVVYLGNLYEVHRYLGRSEAAAAYAERLSAALAERGRTEEARRYRRQAETVSAGEPRNRVVAVVDGVFYELDEVVAVEGKRVQFQFERNRVTLRPAAERTRRGEELGSQGRYEEALALFREAAQADPLDPHARYQEGYTLLHLQRYPQAVESYQTAEELAPGWFHCRTDLWLAQQLVLGHLGHDTGVAVLVLENSPLPPEENVRLAEQILSRAPDLAPAHLLLGQNLARLGRGPDAQAAFRRGLDCAAEPDVRTRLLVELGVRSEDHGQRDTLLREAQALQGNLVAAAQATLALRAFAAPP